MTYIANFLTQNIIEQQTEEVPEYDEESGEMKQRQDTERSYEYGIHESLK